MNKSKHEQNSSTHQYISSKHEQNSSTHTNLVRKNKSKKSIKQKSSAQIMESSSQRDIVFVPPKIVCAHQNVICCTQLKFN